jgi:hypothetical protein
MIHHRSKNQTTEAIIFSIGKPLLANPLLRDLQVMPCLLIPFLVLLLSCHILSKPLDPSSSPPIDDPDITGPGILATPTYTTISLPGSSGDPFVASNQVTGLGEPISDTSFFSIGHECFSDTSVIDQKVYKNKAEFFETAYKDAVAIADQATKWPMYGTDVSNLYFGPRIVDEAYSNDIVGKSITVVKEGSTQASNVSKANLKVAADWDHPRFGFDNYIVSSPSHYPLAQTS